MSDLSNVFLDEQFLESLGITLKYNEGICGARKVRYLPLVRTVQLSDDNFDRWANSVEAEFDLSSAYGRAQFEGRVRVERKNHAEVERHNRTIIGKLQLFIRRFEYSFWQDWDSFSPAPMRWRDFAVICLSFEYNQSTYLEVHTALLGFHVMFTFYRRTQNES